ncbi:MAG: alpha/beta hydrolase [Candidatus Gastranaerophilales bacterium]|nr:alpha/beta hydrolase [Candidatus Gastranaerophilales bacterium]
MIKRKIVAVLSIFIVLVTVLLCSAASKNQNSDIETFLKTEDGIKIAINHYKTNHNEVLIIAPGWFMSKDSKAFADMSKDFSKYFDIITMDFRGHCKSGGTFTFTSKEPLDLETVVQYAKPKYKKVYIAGFSLGAATTAIYTAHNKDVDKLILVSAPVSFDKIENEMWRKEAYIPTLQKFEFKRWCTIRPGKIWLNKTAPLKIIDRISPIPILIIAGENDPTIHLWHSEILYDKANNPKDIWIIKNGNHAEDLYLKDPKLFIKNCTQWLKS